MSQQQSKLYRYRTLETGEMIGEFLPIAKDEIFANAVTTKTGSAFPADVLQNLDQSCEMHNALANLIGLKKSAFVNQEHKGKVLHAEKPGLLGNADAIISNMPGLGVCCRSADCPLIIVVDPSSKSVGIAHASWRSTLEKVSANMIEKMIEKLGANPQKMIACISPSASPENFEVGLEVYQLAQEKLGQDAKYFFLPGETPDKKLFDLWSANISQIQLAGIPFANTYTARVCTIEDPLYPSYRREKAATRFAAIAGVLD